uniref:Uncharacterized protein n=1 Tax=Lepeophtheirus salmonis TaxID=72036 RepID=A0A0K2UP33_LEPSM
MRAAFPLLLRAMVVIVGISYPQKWLVYLLHLIISLNMYFYCRVRGLTPILKGLTYQNYSTVMGRQK